MLALQRCDILAESTGPSGVPIPRRSLRNQCLAVVCGGLWGQDKSESPQRDLLEFGGWWSSIRTYGIALAL